VFDKNRFKVDTYNKGISCTWGEELLKIHISYLKLIQSIKGMEGVKGFAHITGGGLPGNLSRILPPNCLAVINKSQININPVYHELQSLGDISDKEMYNVFNMGVGLVVVVDSSRESYIIQNMKKYHNSYDVGYIDGSNNGSKVVINDS